jgi:5-methyltetrahydropteroyltriglutamate--homocysteine methyltransferase
MDRSVFYRDLSDAEFVKAAEMHVAAINQAIEGIPRDRVRLHCCWGNWDGPHIYDVALDTILPVLYQAKVGALSIPFANPRHQHEYEALRRQPLPEGMVLLPGVIDSTTNFVEHPEVIAGRLQNAVSAVGDRERVIACGMAEAEIAPPGRRHRVGSFVEPKGSVRVVMLSAPALRLLSARAKETGRFNSSA